MAIINTSNYGSVTYSSGTMQWATVDADIFNRTHVSNTAQALEVHDHTSGFGVGVGRLTTTHALTNGGDVLVGSSTVQYRDSGNNTHTLVALDTNNVFAAGAINDFSAQTGANSFKVPVIAGAAPTQSGALAYNSTTNQLEAGANGATVQVLTTSSTLGVSQGGTGAASLTAHGVLVGEGTGAVVAVTGSTNQVLHANTGGDPTFSQIVGGDIASSTIAGGNLILKTIDSTRIADGTITNTQISGVAAIARSKLDASLVPYQNAGDNGKVVQGATGSSNPGSTTPTFAVSNATAVTFPAAFATTPYLAVASQLSNTAAGAANVTTTGFNLYVLGPSPIGAFSYSYVAIG